MSNATLLSPKYISASAICAGAFDIVIIQLIAVDAPIIIITTPVVSADFARMPHISDILMSR